MRPIFTSYMATDKKLILASGSPRRKYLLEQLLIPFEVLSADVDESFDESMPFAQVPVYLAEKKARAVAAQIGEEQPILAADTIVELKGRILGKPVDADDAIRMLHLLSGHKHTVVSGVCLLWQGKAHTLSSHTDVYFRELRTADIEWYVQHYQPLDKAGSYAIQEWIGMVGIDKIDGCYFNVMGLPVQETYALLRRVVGISDEA